MLDRMTNPDLLRCPVSGQPLALVPFDAVAVTVPVERRVDAFLLREDKTFAYPIHDDIPDLRPEAAIPVR